MDQKYGDSIIKDAYNFYNVMSEPSNKKKKIVLLGENLSGKSEVIKIVSKFVT